MKQRRLAPLACAILQVTLATPVHGVQPTGTCDVGEANACVIRLKGPPRPGISPNCASSAWKQHLKFEQPDVVSNANGDAYWETVLSLDLSPAGGCNCAVFRIHYDARPGRWTVDIGDSPTNDGYGGDGGTTVFCAEAQVHDETISAYTAEGPRVGPTEELLRSRLPPLRGKVLELRVCDQAIVIEVRGESGGDPIFSTRLTTPRTLRLFALAGERDPVVTSREGVADSVLHAAFNRVIDLLAGPPAKPDRIGWGVRRVEVFLTP